MQKNTTKAYEKTIWIDKKTIISAHLLNKVEDKLLDLDSNLINKAELNDVYVNKDSTWSSDKISTWSMEQDGVFWVEKENNFINVDNTYEYKLKEIEIFGDTWQDKDSINLFSTDRFHCSDLKGFVATSNKLKLSQYSGKDMVIDYTCDLKPNTNYTLSYVYSKTNQDGDNYRSVQVHFAGTFKRNTVNNSHGEGGVYQTINFFTNDNPVVTIYFYGNSDRYIENSDVTISSIQLEEGTAATPYEPYYKADLSNIQHVGELYVDEKDQPILDKQGKKQYKVEIESVCSNILDKNLFERTVDKVGIVRYEFTQELKGSPLEKDITYYFKRTNGVNVQCLFYYLDENKKRIASSYFYDTHTGYKIPNRPSNAKFYLLEIRPKGGQIQYNDNVDDFFENHYDIRIGLDTWNEYTPYIPPNRQTILLPCQLMKVGDIKDRLYWDNNRGKYIVEKNIMKHILNGKEMWDVISWGNLNNTIMYRTCIDLNKVPLIVKGYKFNGQATMSNPIDEVGFLVNQTEYTTDIRFSVLKSLYPQVQDFTNALSSNYIEIYYQTTTPDLIATNITEPLYLPTYNNKTHIYHINNNNAKATIKAKFPLKTASAVANLSLENTKNSKDILDIKELNVNMVATNFDMDYRLLELEWALEDAGITNINLLNTLNIDIKNNKTLTRYEQAKIIIIKHAYEYEVLTKQLSRYLEKDIITQDEYNELIALMEENE